VALRGSAIAMADSDKRKKRGSQQLALMLAGLLPPKKANDIVARAGITIQKQDWQICLVSFFFVLFCALRSVSYDVEDILYGGGHFCTVEDIFVRWRTFFLCGGHFQARRLFFYVDAFFLAGRIFFAATLKLPRHPIM